jgi:hypothetical protein
VLEVCWRCAGGVLEVMLEVCWPLGGAVNFAGSSHSYSPISASRLYCPASISLALAPRP